MADEKSPPPQEPLPPLPPAPTPSAPTVPEPPQPAPEQIIVKPTEGKDFNFGYGSDDRLEGRIKKRTED